MGKPDRPSRRLDWKIGVEKNNENQVFIKNYWIHSLAEVVIEGPEVEIVEKIKNARNKDKEVVRVAEEMKKTGVKVLQGEEWQIEGELMLKKEKVYMLKDEALRVEIIWLHHNIPVAEHREKWKMTELVTQNWQPGVTKDIGKYVKGYDMCQRMKNRIEILMEKLKLSEILEKLWTYLIVDFITKLPLVVRKVIILVVCNRLSKMIYFITMMEGTSAKGLARLFRDNVWKLHRLLKSIVLDRELQFAVEIIKKLNSILDIETRLSMLFYPQTDGQTKHMDQELEQYLQFFVDHRQEDWLEQLASVEFAINNKAYSTTKVFLFIENYRRELRMEVGLRRKEKMKKAIEFVERIRRVWKEIGVALKRV